MLHRLCVSKGRGEETEALGKHRADECPIGGSNAARQVNLLKDLVNVVLEIELSSVRVDNEPCNGSKRWDANWLTLGVDDLDCDEAILVDSLEARGNQNAKVAETLIFERKESDVFARKSACWDPDSKERC